jgi:hypothetical protein
MKNERWINIAFTTTVGVLGLVPGMSYITPSSYTLGDSNDVCQTTKFSITREYNRHEMYFTSKFPIKGTDDRQKAIDLPVQIYDASGTATSNSFILG